MTNDSYFSSYLKYEKKHWGTIRPLSRRLAYLCLLLSLIAAILLVRNGYYPASIPDDYLQLNNVRFEPQFVLLARHWLAMPILLLGLIVGMWCIEDYLRRAQKGWLDEFVLTEFTPGEIMRVHAYGVTSWIGRGIAVWFAVLSADVTALWINGHIGFSLLVVALGDLLMRAGILVMVVLFAALASWRAFLTRGDPLDMLSQVVWKLFRFSVGFMLLSIGWNWLVNWSYTQIRLGWLTEIDIPAPVLFLLREGTFHLVVLLTLAWTTLITHKSTAAGFRRWYLEND